MFLNRKAQPDKRVDLDRSAQPFLKSRQMNPEMMDDPALEHAEHVLALKILARINVLSRTAPCLADEIGQMLTVETSQTVRILDLGCGGGDVVFALQPLLKHRQIRAAVDGCDVSSSALDRARGQAKKLGSTARFFHLDVRRDPLPEDYDLLVSSLFFHHIPDQEIVPLLIRMACSAHKGFVISDLERCRVGYLLAFLVSRLLTRSQVVRTDSLLSVRAAFTVAELDTFMFEAGLRANSRIVRRLPSRLMLSWRRP